MSSGDDNNSLAGGNSSAIIYEAVPGAEKQPLLSYANYSNGQSPEYAEVNSSITDPKVPKYQIEEGPAVLSTLQVILFGAPEAAMSFMMGASSGWLTYYYLPPSENSSTDAGDEDIVYTAVFTFTALFGRILTGVLEPGIGYISDKTRTRFGRRLPFMFIFAPLAAVTWMMLWNVPFENKSIGANIWFMLSFMLNNFFMACVLAPYTSMVPEITENRKERLNLGSSMGLWGLLGNLLVAIMGPVDDALGSGINLGGYHMTGIQFLNTILSLAIVFLCWLPLLVFREKPVPSHQISSHNLWHEMKITFRNPTFRTFMGLLGFWMMGITMWQSILPYLCTEVLPTEDGLVPIGGGKTWTGIYSLISLGGAILMVPVLRYMAWRFGKKNTMIFCAYVSAIIVYAVVIVPYVGDPGLYYLFIMIVNAIPVSSYFVLPNILFADVIDYDQKLSGIRREGVYTGVRLFLTRVTVGIGAALIVPLLRLGDNEDNYLGIILVFPVSATFFLIGAIIFHFHKLK